ncbi:MAG TPA: hypothetical protein VLA24_04625 [Pseudomonadales bacterium]|nr:hypothetical protein [Pseudomonadales bacterium]
MLELFFNPALSPVWQSLDVLFGGVASVLSVVAVIYSMTTFKKSLTTSHYSELDNMYFELLKIAIEKPHLTMPNTPRTQEQQAEYDIYAFMVWNFLEAIYDRGKDGKSLCQTWYPIIDSEMQMHQDWFDQASNTVKFKEEFVSFIQRRREMLEIALHQGENGAATRIA